MIISLPCREHLRTQRPDVLILHPPWCDNIPISSTSFLPASLPGWTCPAQAVPLSPESMLPLKEEPQLLLHCQRCTQRLGARQPPAAQPSLHPAPVNLLLPSSITTFHSPLTSRLLILAHFSKLPHPHPPRAPEVSPPGVWMVVLYHTQPSPRTSKHPRWRLVPQMRQVRWSVPTEPACGRLASILK